MEMVTRGYKEEVTTEEARELRQLARDHVWLHREQWNGLIDVVREPLVFCPSLVSSSVMLPSSCRLPKLGPLTGRSPGGRGQS